MTEKECKYLEYILFPEDTPEHFDSQEHINKCEICYSVQSALNIGLHHYKQDFEVENPLLLYNKIIEKAESIDKQYETKLSFFECFIISLKQIKNTVPLLILAIYLLSGIVLFGMFWSDYQEKQQIKRAENAITITQELKDAGNIFMRK